MKKKLLALGLILTIGITSLTGCVEAGKVSHNISQEADNFNVTRRIVVINARTDKTLFEMIGNFSLQNNENNELEIICEVKNGTYKKHFIRLNDNTMYVVEDVSGAYVDKHKYEVNYLPQQLVSFKLKSKD